MSALWIALLALLLAAAPPVARADDEEDDSNPHRMSDPDDDESCGFCHEEDMSLSQSLLDTCLTCHSETEHGGAREHLRARAAEVAAALPTPVKADESATLPLTDEGTIWCGTCHLYHDPRVNEEALLPHAWIPPATGLPGAVRTAMAARWPDLAAKYDEEPPIARFAVGGSTALRLPVDNGELCITCHRDMAGKAK